MFHLYGHQNVFSPERLTSLFPGGEQYTVRGVWPVRPMSAGLLRFRTGTLDLWKYWGYVRCPHCGNETFDNQERRLLYRGVGVLNSLLHPRKSDHRWLFMRVDLAAEP